MKINKLKKLKFFFEIIGEDQINISVILSKIKSKITNITTISCINVMKNISNTKFQYYKKLKNDITPYVNSQEEIITKSLFR